MAQLVRASDQHLEDPCLNPGWISISFSHTLATQALAGFFMYFVIMGENGFLPFTLLGLRKDWDDPHVFVEDSYGQEWVS